VAVIVHRYVQLRLPSGATRKTKRILDATVSVFRAEPVVSLGAGGTQELACYGVEARPATETKVNGSGGAGGGGVREREGGSEIEREEDGDGVGGGRGGVIRETNTV
jgi:hypothetical protein